MTTASSTPPGPRTVRNCASEAPAELRPVVDRVAGALEGVGRLGVAFSGGVDSATLLALALHLLGPDRVVAVTGVSPSLARRDRHRARDVATRLGGTMVEVPTHEGDREDYRRNGPDRCFFCKDELFTVISDELVAEHGLDAVAYGENADDALRPDRPGAGAARRHRVLRPLADAGADKATVRALARWLDVPTADAPASPCLASRIPHGQEVTAEKLAQVEAAEDAVLALGVSDVRVRHHGDLARIEVPPGDLATVLEHRETLVSACRSAGGLHPKMLHSTARMGPPPLSRVRSDLGQ